MLDPKAVQGSSNVLVYNGCAFSPVHSRNSIVVPFGCREVWRIVGNFGKQAIWMGEVEGQHIFTQLLGGVERDYVGACRVFGISDKLVFEQLTRLDHEEMIMSWQGISHPKNSNPFPASFLNFKATLRLAPILIPGRQTFIDWHMDFMTETHAVSYMQESMNSIMRVGLLNLQKFMATGGMPSQSLEMSIRPPASYGISTMPQPTSAPMILYQHMQASDLAGTRGFMQANATYMPPPLQQTAPIFSSDRIDRTVQSLEPTVPLLHQVQPSSQLLASALQEANFQASHSSSMLRPPQSGSFAVGELPRRWSGSGGTSAVDTPRSLGAAAPQPLSFAPGAAQSQALATSAASYPPHLMSAGTLLPGGTSEWAAAPAVEPGSSPPGGQPLQPSSKAGSLGAGSVDGGSPQYANQQQQRQQQQQQWRQSLWQSQPLEQREHSFGPLPDFGEAQLLVPPGRGSLRSQTLPEQSSKLRAMLASHMPPAQIHSSGAKSGTFPGFHARSSDAAMQAPGSGLSLDSLSLTDVVRSSKRAQQRTEKTES
ncbi:g9092 [Coccomyxa elongata]